MITIFLFLIFYFYIYFVGRGYFYLFKYAAKDYFGIKSNIFYPIIGLFFIGNFSVIYNFFFNINSLFIFFITLFPVIYNFKKFDNLNKQSFKLDNLILYIATPVILGISSLNTNLAYDAGLYHLNHQNWLRSSEIVFGLSNNHMRYGYSSIIEYINANFWLENNFLILHFVNIIFIVVFFQFIYLLLSTSHYKFGYAVLIYGLLDNFGFGGGKNGFIEIEAVGKQDSPFAILFIISSFFLICYLKEDKFLAKNSEINLLFTLTLFATQMRILGAIAFLAFLIVVLYKYKLYETIAYFLNNSLLLIFFGFSFLIKNLITSSCLIYPVEISCFNYFEWSSQSGYSKAGVESDVLKNFHIALNKNNFFNWPELWLSKDINSVVIKNYFLTILAILLLLIITQKIFKEQKDVYLGVTFVYTALSFLVWIVSAPGIRMGIGIFVMFVLFLSSIYKGEKKNNLKKKYYKSIIAFYLVVVGLVPQLNNYFVLLENFNNLEIVEIKPQQINYITNSFGYGVLPEVGDQCWINLDCVRNKNVLKDNYFSYVIFKD